MKDLSPTFNLSDLNCLSINNCRGELTIAGLRPNEFYEIHLSYGLKANARWSPAFEYLYVPPGNHTFTEGPRSHLVDCGYTVRCSSRGRQAGVHPRGHRRAQLQHLPRLLDGSFGG